MKKTALLLGLTLSASIGADGEDLARLTKPYFAQTKAGTYAKFEQTSTDPKGKKSVVETTIARLENEGEKVWIENRIEPKAGSKQKAGTTRFLLNPRFQPEKNPLDFVKYIERVVTQDDGQEAVEMPWEALKPLMQSVLGFVDFGSDVVEKGPDTVDGRACERFAMSGRYEIKILFINMKGTYESDLWLSDAVPFGRLKEVDVMKDDKGNVTKTEWKLLGTGSGYTSKITGPVKKSEPLPKLPFGG
ncbi:MAG TPA: hypothetical protein VGM13_08565 [Thermoanaerobaculia bacterium]|jgi:hypothetical protein